MQTEQRILITGGTGFLGRLLTARLLDKGFQVSVLSRSADKVASIFSDRVVAVTSIDYLPDAGHFRAVVNLAGAGIFDSRWTEQRKSQLRDSRILLTDKLASWISTSDRPTEVLVSGSAIGVYGDQGSSVLTESSPSIPDFAQRLCADWEASALRAEASGSRVCLIRTGLVLGEGGGILQRMLLPFRLGLGGSIGDGRQWMSWIHWQDWVNIVETMIINPSMRGAYNATAPNAVDNRLFCQSLARVLQRPMLLPLPAWSLKLLLGEMAELVLASQRVSPQRLLSEGFEFQYPELEPALRNVLGLS